jgi:hypothetical protein
MQKNALPNLEGHNRPEIKTYELLFAKKLRRIPATAVAGKNSNSENRRGVYLAIFSSQTAYCASAASAGSRLQLIRENACIFERSIRGF